MKKSLIGVMIIMAVLGMTAAGFAAEVAKIGTFNLQQVLNESSAGKLMQQQLKSKFEALNQKLKAEKTAIDELQKALEREALVLSAEKSDEKKREFRIRVNDFKKMQVDFNNEMKKLENEYKGKVVKDTFEIVEKIGKDEGYMLILEKKTAGVFYDAANLDITEQIIKLYNIKTAKSQ